jgi:hypothetical protein
MGPVGSPEKSVQNFDFLTLEDGTDRLSRNVGTELPFNAAQYQTVQISGGAYSYNCVSKC